MAITQDQALAALQAQLDAERAENARLVADKAKLQAKADSRNVIRFKVSDKRCLSVYGLGRFPTTLYAGQWERLVRAIPELVEFIEENRDELAWKE